MTVHMAVLSHICHADCLVLVTPASPLFWHLLCCYSCGWTHYKLEVCLLGLRGGYKGSNSMILVCWQSFIDCVSHVGEMDTNPAKRTSYIRALQFIKNHTLEIFLTHETQISPFQGSPSRPMTSALPLKGSTSGCCHTGTQALAQKLLRKTPELFSSHRWHPPALVLGCDRV